jgi:ABC-type uncharacterized transport system permease subunit
LGVFLVAINFSFLPVQLFGFFAIAGAFIFGAAWAFIPAYLTGKKR